MSYTINDDAIKWNGVGELSDPVNYSFFRNYWLIERSEEATVLSYHKGKMVASILLTDEQNLWAIHDLENDRTVLQGSNWEYAEQMDHLALYLMSKMRREVGPLATDSLSDMKAFIESARYMAMILKGKYGDEAPNEIKELVAYLHDLAEVNQREIFFRLTE